MTLEPETLAFAQKAGWIIWTDVNTREPGFNNRTQALVDHFDAQVKALKQAEAALEDLCGRSDNDLVDASDAIVAIRSALGREK